LGNSVCLTRTFMSRTHDPGVCDLKLKK
jgi:hypothetical protein